MATSKTRAAAPPRPEGDLGLLLDTLPLPLRRALRAHPVDDLVEVVLDLGRPPEARFFHEARFLLDRPVTRDDLAHVLALVGEFTADNRAGIEATLHRVSCLRSRRGDVVGLTLRVGRAVFGTIDLVRDLVEGGGNLLLMGRPGVG
ncbi:MAG: R3H domain-containing nucleic acid-binding protein, partial [Deferrisomatales bacterium]